MSKLSIIAVALLASYGINANEKDKASDIYSEIMDGLKVEKAQIASSSISTSSNYQESDEKSRYRNLKKLSELKNDYFGEKISELKNEQEIRQLEFLLKLPIEKTFKDFNPEWTEDEDSLVVPDNKPRLPAIKDQSLSFSDFTPETYKIDQLVIKEKIVAPVVPVINSEPGNITLESGNVTVIEPQLKDISLNDVSTIEDIQAIDDIQDLTQIEDNSIEKIEDISNNEERLTDAELEELNWPREEYEKWLAEHKSHDEKREQVKSEAVAEKTNDNAQDDVAKVVVVQYAEIKNLAIKKVIIFGDRKQIDLELDIYVGDGINGDSRKKKLKAVSEGNIITYKGFKFKINAITSSEVEILDLASKKIYLASTNLSSL